MKAREDHKTQGLPCPRCGRAEEEAGDDDDDDFYTLLIKS